MTEPAPWVSLDEATTMLHTGTGRGVRVAVIDSGIEVTHPRLAGVTLADDVSIVSDGLRLSTQPNAGRDDYGHGTAVAGIIHEVAPDAELGSFHTLDAQLDARSAAIREAVRQALDKGYHIINCSFGCGVLDQVLDYKEWVDEAYLKGVHIVAACSNRDCGTPEWPAYFSSVITVNMARTPESGQFWYRHGEMVEFAARGVDVDVAWCGGRTKTVTGSSFAAPRVAGMLARMLSVRPDLTPTQVKALLHRLAAPWSLEIRGPNVRFST